MIEYGLVGVAVFFAALWWGERGRRIDILHLAGLRARPGVWSRTKEAVMGPPKEDPSPPAAMKAFTSDEREAAIQSIAREGAMDHKTAEAHFDELLHEGWGG